MVFFAANRAIAVSQEKCGKRMKAQSPILLSKYRSREPNIAKLLEKVEVSLPSVTYRDKLCAHLDDKIEAEIVHSDGTAHTDGDSIVHIRDDRVVFAGDVLWVDYHPNLEDAHIQGQIRALKTIVRWNPRRIVPGHGPVCGLPELRRFIRYLEELDKNCPEGFERTPR